MHRSPNSTQKRSSYNITVKNQRQIILKSARENNILTYMGSHIRLSADGEIVTSYPSRDWDDIFKALKEKIPVTKNTSSGKIVLCK